MARLDQTGFEFNSTNADVNGGDTFSGSTIGTTHVRSGTYGLRVSSLVSTTPQGYEKKNMASGAADSYLRAYVYIVTLPSATNQIININASSTLGASVRASIALTSAGTLVLQNAVPTQIGSASAAINDSNWHMVELRSNTIPASGSRIIEARLDGSVFATSSVQSQGTAQGYSVGGNLGAEAQTTGEWWFDDLALNDSSGTSQTSYPGSGKILQLYPNGAGDANGFLVQVGGTIGSTNNYTRVNENPPDDATSYNASAVLNAEDLFIVQDSGIGASDTVNVVMVGVRTADITASDATSGIKLEIEKTSGGTKLQSANLIPNSTTWHTNGTSSPRNYLIITYQDPDGSNWTQTTLDSMQIGYILDTVAVRAVGITNVWASIDYTPATTTITGASTRMMTGMGM